MSPPPTSGPSRLAERCLARNGLLAADSVAVAIQAGSVAGVAEVYRGGTGGASLVIVRVLRERLGITDPIATGPDPGMVPMAAALLLAKSGPAEPHVGSPVRYT